VWGRVILEADCVGGGLWLALLCDTFAASLRCGRRAGCGAGGERGDGLRGRRAVSGVAMSRSVGGLR
jgi:hypothetical protein